MDGIIPAPITPTKGKKSKPSAPATTGMELGLLLSLLIFALYFYGFVESVYALPELQDLAAPIFGANLNLPIDRYESPDGSQAVSVPLSASSGGGKVMRTSNATIPTHVWPPSVKNEPNNFETILHPGDLHTEMSVPNFWSPPVHQGGLMTRELAMEIGSCNEPSPEGKVNRGDHCPPDERTIYFSIASYRDFECRFTVESAFMRAKNPRRIRVGVVDQIIDGEDPACNEPIEPCDVNPNQALCLYQDRIDVYQMDADLSIGPVFARHVGHRLYRGEYYYTQSDAHVTYTQNWDEDIIQQMETTKNELAVLTTYLTDVQGSISDEGVSLRHTRPIMCNTDYEGGGDSQHLRHGSQPERVPTIHGEPQMEPYWAAGYSFSRGHFVVNVPYDLYQPMIFQGEEMSIGIRGFSVGYDMYAPARSVCFHHYAVGNNAKVRNKVPHFWENGQKYKGIGASAMKRLLGIVRMNPEIPVTEWDHRDEEIYGLGGVRTPEKFYETFGIDVVNKKTEHHLCRFVEKGVMHNDFEPFLNKDGMGVDYGQITYRFVDPAPDESTPGLRPHGRPAKKN